MNVILLYCTKLYLFQDLGLFIANSDNEEFDKDNNASDSDEIFEGDGMYSTLDELKGLAVAISVLGRKGFPGNELKRCSLLCQRESRLEKVRRKTKMTITDHFG